MPKGEEFAARLFAKGYKNLHLATGYDAKQFKDLNWLICVGKESPWEENRVAG